ncbi:MAG: hypothetical protein ABI083_00555 [Lapillicoccus sp.]
MRRTNGIAVIAAAAALGVTAAVVVGSDGRLGGRVAGGPTTAASTAPDATTPSPTGSGATPVTTPPPKPSTPSPSAPSTPPRTTTPPATTSTTLPAVVVGKDLNQVNLIQSKDFATAGWNTDQLEVSMSPGETTGRVSACQQAPMARLPGAVGTPMTGDYQGLVQSAHETAIAFRTQEQAYDAYQTVVGWYHDCLTYAPGVAIGSDVGIDLDDQFDRAMWVSIDGVPSLSGAGGVALVGTRVALFQVNDSAPRVATVSSLLVSVAKGLSPELSGN